MGKHRNKLSGQASLARAIKGVSEPLQTKEPRQLCLNFKNFYPHDGDGQTFLQWEQASLLSKALDRCTHLCKQSIKLCVNDQTVKVYGGYPAHSKFKKPRHIPPDAEWASLQVQGKERIVGHVIGEIFYVVFLDKDHEFWPTEKKNT